MASPDSKNMDRIESLDRISQLPESMILSILSRLPLEDSDRASTLSKTWKSICSSHPILYFDHNLFAYQSLISTKEGGGGPDFNQIRDIFIDGVDYPLSCATQLDSPIRKLALTVAIDDSMYFSRVDKWMKLVKQMNVEDLCITVQTVDFMWYRRIYSSSVAYDFPSKGLRSATVRGCKLGLETFVNDLIYKSSSLQRLCLSYVFIYNHALDNVITCCHGLETLVLEVCSFEKRRHQTQIGTVKYVDIVDTNLESLKCDAETELRINASACAGIRVLTLGWCIINQPYLFEDLTATFPLLEEAEFYMPDIDILIADSKVLRKLTFRSYCPVCVTQVHIDCPNLTLLYFSTRDLTDLYVDCPKLRVFKYRGTTIPDHASFSSLADLEESHCVITMDEAYDALWLVNLTAFLVLVTGNASNVRLTVVFSMAKFEPEKVEAIEVSSRYIVDLCLVLVSNDMEDIAPLIDGLLWIIRPTTLTVSCGTYYVVKYICENLFMKQEGNICDLQQQQQLTHHPCWMPRLEDFHVECPLDVPVTKDNLPALPEQCRPFSKKQIRFKFQWCFNR